MSDEKIISNTEKEVENTSKTKEESSKRYQMIKELDKNLWTFGSPIIVRSGVLEKDIVSQKNRLTLKFVNIYRTDIKDVNLLVIAKDSTGAAEEVRHSYKSLAQKYLATKGVFKMAIENENADEFTIIVESVVFEDGRVWNKKDAILKPEGEMDDEQLEAFAEENLDTYDNAYKSGKKTVQSDDPDVISEGIKTLEKVHWYMDADELLDNAYKKYEAAKQNVERRLRGENARERRTALVRKRFKIAGITVVVAAVLAVLSVVAYFIPNGKYQLAIKDITFANSIKERQQKIDRDKYEKAAKKFAKLNGFRKSEDYEAEAYYNVGLTYINSADETTAKKYFKKSYDASKGSDYGKMSGAFLDYYKGEEALKANKLDEALKLFKASADSGKDFSLVNKASEGIAHVSYMKAQSVTDPKQKSSLYESAWHAIENLFAKDKNYSKEYGEYGYGYAKFLIDNKSIDKGIEIYNKVSKYTKNANLNSSIYAQAVKLAEGGKIAKSMDLLEKIKKGYKPASSLYEKMYSFDQRIKGWLGLWKHHGKVEGKKKTYRIYISEVLYKGDMCLKIKDKNNKKLGFETVISRKNHVTKIVVGSYMIKFKLKRYQDQKFVYALKEPNKMVRTWKYGKDKFKTKYKRKVK